MKIRGVAYYPEAWPRERWDEDIALMRAAGINLVRMGEFAWARFEPGEDRYDLGWWTDICDRMRRAEIQVLACTPSAAPPAWLTSRHPEVLAVAADGSRPPHGIRRHYCPNAPHYRERAAKVNRRIADAVRGNPAVIAWQIDNEIAPEPFLCHCEVCAAGFREWLRARYGTLAALNDAWGNAFWSGDFSDWEQIRPPRYRPSWRLDYQRFQDVSFRDFIQGQAATLRAVRADWTVLANLWVGLNPIADAALLNEGLDVAAYDGYWDCYASREHYSAIWDLYRNIAPARRPFWLAETGAWNPCRTVADGRRALRPWAFEAFAKGAEAHIFFRWRQSRMGEEEHPAILDWSGRPGRTYDQVRALFHEFHGLEPRMRGLPLPQPEVAILYDYDTAALLHVTEGTDGGTPHNDHVAATAAALGRMQVVPDILPARPGLSLAPYRLVVLPSLEMADPWLAAALDAFAAAGGVVLAQTRLATRDRNGKFLTDPMPVGLTALFGVDVRERCRVERRHRRWSDPDARVAVDCGGLADGGAASVAGIGVMEMLETGGACTVLGRYASGNFSGAAALTERAHGRGAAIYQGCLLEEEATARVLAHALRRAAVAVPPPTPPGIEIIPRPPFRFYLNHTDQPAGVPLIRPGRALVGSVESGRAALEPFGVCVIEEDA